MAIQKPQITWFIYDKDSKTYLEEKEYYAGTYNQENDLEVFFMIWNNRYGTTTVEDLRDFSISVSFDDAEDMALLNYCVFMVNNAQYITPTVVGNQSVIKIPESIVLSGAVNDGTEASTDNYMTLKFVLSVPEKIKIKMNDLKGITFDIIPME